MSLSHRLGSERRGPASPLDDVPASPPATRGRRSRWADPRLWVGVLLVLASLLVGARVFASADDTVAVEAMDHDAVAGAALTPGDLHLTSVHFTDSSEARRYVTRATTIAAGATLTRDVGAGELLTTTSVSLGAGPVDKQLPLGVGPAGMPAGLAAGDRVDVWAVPASDSSRRRSPVAVLRGVTVTAVGGAGLGGLGGDRQILVTLAPRTDVGRALAALNGSSVVLIRNGS
ncbi:MAG: hypothetical protein QOK30_1544 [Nocardioidaceae bacterium]|nr:hypothetical protein [Nocardioidaceae bacterium]